MASPFANAEVKELPPLPADLSSVQPGQYTVKCEDYQEIGAKDGVVQAALWFQLPPITESILNRIQALQLHAHSGDQGTVTYKDQGTWTWFEIVVLENEKSKVPMIKNKIEHAWKSHLNPMETEGFKWNKGKAFDQKHNLLRSLEIGNIIAVRICARFRGWQLRANKGYLAVEIGDKPAKIERAGFDEFQYVQDTLQMLNAQKGTGFNVKTQTPSTRADGFDVDCTGNERPLRVLSLDGGGVRGLSSLYILRAVMVNISGSEEKPAMPCDMFDMIAGTSTGGLCAIMLGRLKMSVDECIKVYEAFMRKIFPGKRPHKLFFIPWEYNASVLETVLKDIIEKHRKIRDEPLLAEFSEPRVFVLAVREDAVGNKAPVFLRSYTNSQPQDEPQAELPNIKIWEAARTTTAAPTYFKAMEVDGHKLIDGGLGANNPVGWLWNEVLSVYGANRPIQSLLSIGTGIPKNYEFGVTEPSIHDMKRLPYSLSAAVTNAEITHLLFRTLLDAYAPLPKMTKYWRLNVGREIPGWPDPNVPDNEEIPDLDDTKGIDGFVKRTIKYIEMQGDLIRRCADTIPKKPTEKHHYLEYLQTQPLARTSLR